MRIFDYEMSKMCDRNSGGIRIGSREGGPLLVLRRYLVRCPGTRPGATQRGCQTRGLVRPGRNPGAIGREAGPLPARWIAAAAHLQRSGQFGDHRCLRELPRNVARRRRVRKALCRPQAVSCRRNNGLYCQCSVGISELTVFQKKNAQCACSKWIAPLQLESFRRNLRGS